MNCNIDATGGLVPYVILSVAAEGLASHRLIFFESAPALEGPINIVGGGKFCGLSFM